MKFQNVLLALFSWVLFAGHFLTMQAPAQESTQRVEITAGRFAYTPNIITLKKGRPTVLILKSIDVTHGLHFKELNLQTKVAKGATSELAFTPDKVGDYVGQCSVFCGSGHGSMALTLHVVE
jgi:cytochrome c oxidase subunit 2